MGVFTSARPPTVMKTTVISVEPNLNNLVICIIYTLFSYSWCRAGSSFRGHNVQSKTFKRLEHRLDAKVISKDRTSPHLHQ